MKAELSVTPVKMRLSVAQEEFVTSESIKIQIDIENNSERTVRVPDPAANTNNQPQYNIEGPKTYGTKSISLGEAVNAAQSFQEPHMVELEPNAALSRTLPINRLLGTTPSGEYTVQARLSLESTAIASNTIRFSVSEPRFIRRALAVEAGNLKPFPIIMQLLSATGRIYTATFSYQRQMLRTELYALDHYADLDKEVTSIHESLLSHAELGTPTIRTLWTKPGEIGITDFGSNAPVTAAVAVDAKVPAASLIDKSGTLETVVLEGDRLTMIRFPAKPMFTSGSRHWSMKVERPLSAIVSTISSERAGSLRAVAFMSRSSGGALLTTLVWDENGALIENRTASLEKLFVPRNSSISAFIDDRNRLHVAAVLYKPVPTVNGSTSEPTNQMVLVEYLLKLGKTEKPQKTLVPLVTLNRLPKATLAKYSDLPSRNRKLTWLLLTNESRLLTEHSQTEGFQTTHSPDIPLCIIDGDEGSFLLTKQENGIPVFEPVR